jgi:hypothetical protein
MSSLSEDSPSCENEIASTNFAMEFLNSLVSEAEAESTKEQPAAFVDQLPVVTPADSVMPQEEDNYFYSVVHGYRIKKPETSDTSSEYTRILQGIKVVLLRYCFPRFNLMRIGRHIRAPRRRNR